MHDNPRDFDKAVRWKRSIEQMVYFSTLPSDHVQSGKSSTQNEKSELECHSLSRLAEEVCDALTNGSSMETTCRPHEQ